MDLGSLMRRGVRWSATAIIAFSLDACSGTTADVTRSVPASAEQSAVRSATLQKSNAGIAVGTEKVLYSFSGVPDGAYPNAGLTILENTLYGTTYGGGTATRDCGPSGCGTVFKLTTSGDEQVITRDFRGGENPNSGLLAVGGLLYGTTLYSSLNGDGSVFAVSPAGDLRTIHNFMNDPDGASPVANLIVADGALYGTTAYGGYPPGSGNGTVYKISTAGAEHVVYSFGGSWFPEAPLLDVRGTLYGTTDGGGGHECKFGLCGTVFKISANGTHTDIHDFAGGSDGAYPVAGLIEVGHDLYGTTAYGGGTHCGAGCGTVYKIARNGTESVVYRFKGGADGEHPKGPLLNVGGVLYGTTSHGGGRSGCGTSYECGTVFKLTTSGEETVMHRFAGKPSDGGDPVAGLADAGGMLYGTTILGGANDLGTVFSIQL